MPASSLDIFWIYWSFLSFLKEPTQLLLSSQTRSYIVTSLVPFSYLARFQHLPLISCKFKGRIVVLQFLHFQQDTLKLSLEYDYIFTASKMAGLAKWKCIYQSFISPQKWLAFIVMKVCQGERGFWRHTGNESVLSLEFLHDSCPFPIPPNWGRVGGDGRDTKTHFISTGADTSRITIKVPVFCSQGSSPSYRLFSYLIIQTYSIFSCCHNPDPFIKTKKLKNNLCFHPVVQGFPFSDFLFILFSQICMWWICK